MYINVTEAKARLTELIRRAEAGEEVVLTRHGQPAVKLTAVETERSQLSDAEIEARYQRLLEISKRAAAKALPGSSAAHSADFLYDDDGLPV